jgi:hypothetical protein
MNCLASLKLGSFLINPSFSRIFNAYLTVRDEKVVSPEIALGVSGPLFFRILSTLAADGGISLSSLNMGISLPNKGSLAAIYSFFQNNGSMINN